jgi:hypothetical protein
MRHHVEPVDQHRLEPNNAGRRAWLNAQLERAAAGLGVTTTKAPVFGWHDRTIGAPVSTADGERWLRVVAEMSRWAGGAFWTGNLDARDQRHPAVTATHVGRPGTSLGNAVLPTGSGSPSMNRRHRAMNWAAGSCRARWHSRS